MQYAIVDIETTGSHAAGAAITEIAILISDGLQVLEQYTTLINPQRPIPRFIQSLTGITNDMVADAPAFDEVARRIHDLLQGNVFVAHNVNFDYSFVKHYLDEAGYRLDARKLCTVRLARKVAPGLRSYSLGRLCAALDIDHRDAHRALGDADATARLLHHLIANDVAGHRETMLKGRNKEQYLPPALPADPVAALPECPGVYYFLNAAGKVIYVGKAINLRKRVKSHFANNKTGRQKADFLREITHIRHEPVANDLMAQILESVEIRRLWPIHNRSQRGYHPKYGLYVYEDRQGYQRLALDSHKPNIKPAHTFNTLHEGHRWLRQLTTEFSLCPRLCNLARLADCAAGQPSEWCITGTCPAHSPAEEYNAQVADAVQWIGRTLPTLALVMPGRHKAEHSCILMERGQFYGMGYLPHDHGTDLHDLPTLKQQLTAYPDNDYIRILVYKWAEAHPEHVLSGVRSEG